MCNISVERLSKIMCESNMCQGDFIDSLIVAENIGFLDDCFDNSFALQASLIAVKEYVAEESNKSSRTKICEVQSAKKSLTLSQSRFIALNNSLSRNVGLSSQVLENSKVVNKHLKNWGLPKVICEKYQQRGIELMFDWQVECLSNPKVLLDCSNLVYSAPTSAGKTLVAEILTMKTILERQKKVIIILPFVSIVREKMFYLQDILSSSGIRVEGFMGSQSPPGGLQAVHVAICTIEKANSLINRLLDEGNIAELGAVIVDELHLLGDASRGYILELLLTKIKYVCTTFEEVNIQIVGMSATLPNLEVLAHWLDAELFITQFRPIPLDEYCLIDNKLYDINGQVSIMDDNTCGEGDSVLRICLNTIKESCSILIFCMTKNWCESLAQSIATSFYKLGCSGNDIGKILRKQLNSESICEVLEQLKNCPVHLDQVLKNTISFGVAYHHAGLTFDERDIIEGAFKSGAIRVLVATSTLSSGVNLPARKVIIRSPMFQRQPINILTYKQMIGRAGRMGKDTKGESILICTETEKKIGFGLMKGALEPVKSCIESEDKYMRAVLEMIASQVACSRDDLELYSRCTLLYHQKDTPQINILENTLKELQNYELVRVQEDGNAVKYVATSLGKACLSSSMAPNDGLSLFCELQKARQCLVLETDLHLIYLVTPYSVSGQWGSIDWLHLLTLWESLTKAMKRVGELVGVQESFIIRCLRGTNKMGNIQNKLNIHKRFYTALALQDLVNEVPLSEVATKFQCARGFLQSLQQAAATFAGMVTAFCHQLGWKNMEMLISQFQDRLHFGIHSELLDLMKLPTLNGVRARTLFDAGFETVSSVASADVNVIETALYKAVPFQSDKEREGDDTDDLRKRKKLKNIWITGCCAMTAKEAAENLISEARKYLEHEIGVKEIKWDDNIIKKHIKDKDEPLCELHDHKQNIKNVKKELSQTSATAEERLANEYIPAEIKTESNETNSERTMNSDEIVSSTTLERKKSIPNQISQSVPLSIKSPSKSPLRSNNSHEKLNPSNSNISKLNDRVFMEIIPNTSSPIIGGLTKKIIRKSPLQNITNVKHTMSVLKDDIVWDSMNFTEAAIENLTKLRVKNIDYSPNISFGDSDRSDIIESIEPKADKSSATAIFEPLTGKTSSTKPTLKDISLFSSEGDNSSLFEESLPLDMISTKVLNGTSSTQISKVIKQETASDFVSINSNSILNAFKSTIVEVSDEEELNLIYEDDNKPSEINIDNNVSQFEDIVIESQDFNLNCVTSNYKSPYKRQAEINNKFSTQNSAKKAKLETVHVYKPISTTNNENKTCDFRINSKTSKKFTLDMKKQTMICFVLREKDILDNFNVIEKFDDVSMYLDIINGNITYAESEVIGSNIVKSTRIKNVKSKDPNLSIKSMSLYFGADISVFMDFTSVDFSTIKLRLSDYFRRRNLKLKVMHLKMCSVNMLKSFNIYLESSCFDVALADWLIDSDEKVPNLDYLVRLTKKFCEIDISKAVFKVNSKDKKHLDYIENCCLKAWSVWNIADRQLKYLLDQYRDVQNIIGTEVHVSQILAECEYNGLKVDKALASQFLIDVRNAQEALQKLAYQLCGYHFNFNSSKDVAKVLGMYRGRRVSTKKSVLSSHNSPMASVVIYWRKLNTILTKTLYPITEKACNHSFEERINPSYTMFTCTGRIGMHEPNLQSVPRTFTIPVSFLTSTDCNDVMEFNCRKIFQAASGHTLVSADYCQLEMRILTHYSGDEVLTRIMKSDVDVFKAIAASWDNVDEDKVDDDLRQKAKQLCYGILYGMGNKTLSQHLDVSEMEAAVFMDTFYKTYPSIKQFTSKVLEECRRKGYVETLMGRRRYLPDINSDVVSRRGAAERQAVNTTIQGSAADIAKSAMCTIHDKAKYCNTRLILQMHDELIYEVPQNKKFVFANILKDAMETTFRLNVPLPVKVRCGDSWGSLEEIKL